MSFPLPTLAFELLSPAMLGWLAAAAAPLLIHLWSRRRYREMTWAAMEYLLAALRRSGEPYVMRPTDLARTMMLSGRRPNQTVIPNPMRDPKRHGRPASSPSTSFTSHVRLSPV